MAFTSIDRQAGRKAMEESLTPLARALRRFSAGKPRSHGRDDTPLGIVSLAVEQRERLKKILEAEEGIQAPRILAASVVGRMDLAGGGPIPDDDFVINEGRESETVRDLERYRDEGHRFTLSGFVFVVRAGSEMRHFSYRIERTPEGDAVLKLAEDRLLKRPTAIRGTRKDK